ncbi:hypothetical protein FQN60_014678 [Etheostoma spectabile]|uniref:Uncharacterized protein n=1 Tax=Etheostoma spectabile TaxID=54343 RepID=A0A5J5CSQ9_9PERO|nr:hypothetical protein FQN60_014678 [Etheostoma spectabile]
MCSFGPPSATSITPHLHLYSRPLPSPPTNTSPKFGLPGSSVSPCKDGGQGRRVTLPGRQRELALTQRLLLLYLDKYNSDSSSQAQTVFCSASSCWACGHRNAVTSPRRDQFTVNGKEIVPLPNLLSLHSAGCLSG